MRISDWSSDVCSSDLGHSHGRRGVSSSPAFRFWSSHPFRLRGVIAYYALALFAKTFLSDDPAGGPRSEEHTSELQSLMRISYAVFCLKTKNQHTKHKLIMNNTSDKVTTKSTSTIVR